MVVTDSGAGTVGLAGTRRHAESRAGSRDGLPTELVESEQRLVPRLSGTFRWGMPMGFSLEAALDAVVLSNELRVGGAWAFAAGPLSFAIQDRVGLWFGHGGVQGFDASAVGLRQYAGLAVGIAVGESRFQSTTWLTHATACPGSRRRSPESP